ncbi:MAG: signal peptidase II [Gemmatimonadota bacterium]|nr:signal peptidase II [Gemmatimonadota bacterium]
MTARSEERPQTEADAAGARGKTALYLGTVVTVLVLDIITKMIVQRTMTPYQPIPVWGDFFRLTYIFNRGAAFGLSLGDYSRYIFGVLSLLAVVGLFLLFRATPAMDRMRILAIALVTAGAIGNLIDRVRSDRGVVDFLDFGIGTLRWPVFNVADMGVTVGATLLAISLWREEQSSEPDGGG